MVDGAFSQFVKDFPNDTACLEEVRKMKYPEGIICRTCKKRTKHYRIKNRLAYGCVVCRRHTFPLTTTIFEKSSTSLRLWFYALFLMTHTRGSLTVIQLQHELGVTYKTAWRMKTLIKKQMLSNMDDLYAPLLSEDAQISVRKWTFFKHFEIAVIEQEDSTGES